MPGVKDSPHPWARVLTDDEIEAVERLLRDVDTSNEAVRRWATGAKVPRPTASAAIGSLVQHFARMPGGGGTDGSLCNNLMLRLSAGTTASMADMATALNRELRQDAAAAAAERARCDAVRRVCDAYHLHCLTDHVIDSTVTADQLRQLITREFPASREGHRPTHQARARIREVLRNEHAR